MFLFVIPTYNERQNIEPLVESLLDMFSEASVLIVDDDSPDGTGAWAEQFATQVSRFHVLHRKQSDGKSREGIGVATIDGLLWGLAKSFDWLATMDGDGSHDPQDLFAVLDQIDANIAKAWIGSRYCSGGHIESWPWYRRLASRMVNTSSRLFVGAKVSDYSSAYRVYHRSALETIGLQSVKSTGYAYLEEILSKLHRSQISMKEFPITFNNRVSGKSKASPGQAFRAILDLGRIFARRQ